MKLLKRDKFIKIILFILSFLLFFNSSVSTVLAINDFSPLTGDSEPTIESIENTVRSEEIATEPFDSETSTNSIETGIKSEAENLAEAKANAISELEAYVDANDYAEEAEALADAVAAGKEAIENATTAENVATVLADAKAVIDAIKTDADKTGDVAAAVFNEKITTDFSGGSGKTDDPYFITNTTELDNVRNYLDAFYVLANDITFTEGDFEPSGDFYNLGTGWQPIGTDSVNSFSGQFDGNGFEITGLKIRQESNDETTTYFGLFGYNTGTIKNLGLSASDIVVSSSNSSIYTGGIVGYNSGTISTCYNTGSVGGFSYVGGIAGSNYGTISTCYNTGSVSGTSSSYVGGIAGRNYYGRISTCYNTGSVSGTSSSYVGGIAGRNYYGRISTCYNTGSVSGTSSSYVGGIAGYNYDGTISICYNTGSVSGNDYVGGIAGYNSGTISTCYYLNINSKGIGYGSGDTTSCTLEDMKNQNTYVGFDFEAVWEMQEDNDYPFPTLIANTMIDLPVNSADYMSGKGTVYDPYKISTKYHLDNVRKNPGSFYVLENDIIFSEGDFEPSGDFYTLGTGWQPIGTNAVNRFSGQFDGNGFEITGLKIRQESNVGSNTYFGLFGYNTGTIKNLGLSASDIVVSSSNSSIYTGGIVGYNSGTISTCYNTGSVSGTSYVGGIAGYNYSSGTISTCYNTGSVSGTSYCVGGIAGWNDHGTISTCYNTGSVSGTSEVGGIAGWNYYGTISTCYNTGSVSGTSSSYVGGIAGYNYDGTISICYNTGSVGGSSYYVGGIAGYNNGTISTCYYLNINSKGIGYGSGDTTSCTLEDMKNQNTYVGFDFEAVWEMQEDNDYPFPTLIANTMIDLPVNSADYMSGKGTVYDPYKISTKYHLDNVRKNPGSFYVLENDIIFSEGDFEPSGDFYTLGTGWQPIGTNAVNRFSGQFDGNGFEITGLKIRQESNDETTTYFGLFGYNTGTIKNLGLSASDIVVSSSIYTGGIAGYNSGTISTCYNTGSVSGTSYVGGIAGYNYSSGTISTCYNTGSVSGTSYCVGGIAGWNDHGTISTCYNAGSVSGTSEVGGIAGRNYYGTISICYNTGSVSGTSNVGGIAGRNYYGTISTCYNTGSVSGTSEVGGIAGWNYYGTISICYNTGSVGGSSYYVGGIAGYNNGTISTCYYLNINSKGIGYGSGDTTSCTLEDMKNQNTYVGFDFEAVWEMQEDNDYPFPTLIANTMIDLPVNSADYMSGKGTVYDPYKISTKYHLDNVRKNPGSFYVLENDIIFSEGDFEPSGDFYTLGTGWQPIGTNAVNRFSGQFDGNGFEITGLKIRQESNVGSNTYFGLFGYNTGTIKNLGLSASDIVVSSSNSSIYTGGIVGYNSGTISTCYNTGSVSGTSNVGGIAGHNVYGTISTCYNTGSVSGTSERVGGIASWNESGTISTCYNTGSVSGTSEVGGIAGNNSEGTISICYNTGSVSGNDYVGGIAGYNNGTISTCYYLNINSKGIGYGSGDTTSCTLEDMKNQNTYVGFDFEAVWEMQEDNDYPFPTLIANTMIDLPVNSADYMSGKGTVYDPYKISTKYHLDNVRKNPGSFYVLENDIIFSEGDFEPSGDFYTLGTGWQPIGTNAVNRFSGQFDGNGFEITGLKIRQESNVGSNTYFGLFGYNTGTIKNLGLSASDIVVSSSNSSIYTGGIVGYNSGTISTCYNTGSVSGTSNVGGIAGHNVYGTISTCYNTGSVGGFSSSSEVGGIAGRNYYGTISTCYNTGSVSGTSSSYVGGIAGYNYDGTISICYNTGSVSGNDYVGGIAGYNSGTISTCYYLNINSKGIGYGSGDTTSCTLEDMKNQNTYVGFDFEAVWEMQEDNDYPFPTLIANTMIDLPVNSADYMSGKGTVYDPYKISTKYHLDNVRKNPGSFYVLENDIIFSEGDFEPSGDFYTLGTGWQPIGTNAVNRFSGQFDGNGFEITGLKIRQESNDETTTYFGLFGYNAGIIKNLGLSASDIVVSSSIYTGGIAGYNSGTISTCYNTGSVSGFSSSEVGGIAGINSGTISTCYNTGSVSGTSSRVGGIAGRNYDGTISTCYNTGSVSGTSNVGGIAGHNVSGTISTCYNTGSVSGFSYVGGIAGYNDGGTISTCYNTGSVSGTSYCVGGIAGWNNTGTISTCYNTGSVSGTSSHVGGIVGYKYSGTISTCYNTGSVSGTSNVGGIAGMNYNGTISICYNTGSVSGTSSHVGGIVGYKYYGTISTCYYLNISSKGIGYGSGDTTSCTLEEMQREETFVGFDFDSIWVMPDIIYTPLLRSIYTPLIGITLEDTFMVTGEKRYLLTPIPINATVTECEWYSTNPSVASVDSDGIVTGLSIGETYITATSKQGPYTDQCLVQVRQGVEHIDLEANLTLYVGDTNSLAATISPVDSYDKSVFWRSSNSNIAEVNQEGLVTAKSPGTAVITVSALDGSGTTAKCTVTVLRYVTGIDIIDPPSNLLVGSKVTLSADVQPSDASNKTIFWSSSDTNIATVNGNGQVTGVSGGYVTITVETQDGSFISDCEVEIIQLVTEIQLSRNTISLAVHKSLQVEATVFPENANNQSIVWTSKNESIATVSQDGMVTGVSQGTAVISAKSADGNSFANCVVIVGVGVEEITISGNTEITRNDSTQMTAVILPETAINKTVEWSVIAKTGTATISADGMLTGESIGTVTVVASATDGSETSGSVVVTILEIQCNVTFVDDDWTTVLDEQILEYGSTPVYAGETPVKAATEEFTYTFAGWDPEIVAVTGDATYTATYDSEHINYTIVFKDWDGSVISSATYHYSDTVVIPVAPARAADDTYIYTFKAWDPEFSATCEADATYTATYTPAFIDYTVEFKDWDGSVISTKTYHYGDTVVVPEDPTRDADDTYTYTFKAWDPEVVDVAAAATYTATYDSEHINYTIVFKDWNGSVINSETYHYGDTVVVPLDPTRDADDAYTYTFDKWDPEVVDVAADATYTATYTPRYIDYTVVFKDWDGSVISTKTSHYGETVLIPENPSREADDTYTYMFKVWDPEVSTTCAGDAIYTATYTPSYIDYTVVFKDWDDGVISSETYHYGDTVVVPEDPTRAADDTYTYTFDKWDPEVVDVAADATYTATYTPRYIDYTIVFKDWDGSVINSETYHYEDTVVVPEDPTRDADDTYTYTFDKWDLEVIDVAADATYTATYTPSYIDFTVEFHDWDGSVISSETYHYGDTVVVPEDPTRDADGAYTYTFDKWDPEIVAVTADATYTATYTPSYIDYTVVFQDWDGSVISTKTSHYGETVLIPENPSREADDTYTYTFDKWDPEVVDVAADATYTATYTPRYIDYTIVFKDWDGSVISTKTHHYGDPVTIPADPTREGHTFTGWDPALPDTMPAENLVEVAKWTINQYTITFDSNGGTVVADITQDYGTVITAPVDPTREGYIFDGWLPDLPDLMPAGGAGLTAQWTVEPISVSKLPTKVHYIKGESLDVSGGEIRVNNSLTLAMSEANVGAFDSNSKVYGPKTITVEYGGATTSFTVYLNRFSDVPYGYDFYPTIMDLAGKGIVAGYSDGRYGVNDNITRAQAAVMLVRALGLETEGLQSNFTDVPNNYWAAAQIAAAAKAKIVNGYGDGRFGPDAKITRAELSVMVARAFDIKVNPNKTVSFTDVPTGFWAEDYIKALASNGIVSGYRDGRFGVKDNATRAQFSKFLSYSLNLAK